LYHSRRRFSNAKFCGSEKPCIGVVFPNARFARFAGFRYTVGGQSRHRKRRRSNLGKLGSFSDEIFGKIEGLKVSNRFAARFSVSESVAVVFCYQKTAYFTNYYFSKLPKLPRTL